MYCVHSEVQTKILDMCSNMISELNAAREALSSVQYNSQEQNPKKDDNSAGIVES